MISTEEESLINRAGAAFTLTDSRQRYGSEAVQPLIAIDTALCRAEIAVQGAQLLSFTPAGQSDLLWLSPLARFESGTAIRGGIPVCAPWFGVNRRDSHLPKHGFLRDRCWQLLDAATDEKGEARLIFEIASQAADLAIFPWAFTARLEMTLGTGLAMSLSITNTSSDAMPLSLAFHSYFRVVDLEQVALSGLENRIYLDNCRNLQPFRQDDALRFGAEIDRVYEGLGGEQTLRTGSRSLRLAGEGCDTAIVWNPGPALAANMADVGEYYRDYVCVERGAAFADELLLSPGESHRASMAIAISD